MVVVLAQAAIGIVAVLGGPGWIIQTLHVAGASAVWSMVVVLMSMTWQIAPLRSWSAGGRARRARERQYRRGDLTPRGSRAAYFELTKPRVIVLLLITTLAAM